MAINAVYGWDGRVLRYESGYHEKDGKWIVRAIAERPAETIDQAAGNAVGSIFSHGGRNYFEDVGHSGMKVYREIG